MEHYNLIDWDTTNDGGLILYFENGHTFLSSEEVLIISKDIIDNEIKWRHIEYNKEE